MPTTLPRAAGRETKYVSRFIIIHTARRRNGCLGMLWGELNYTIIWAELIEFFINGRVRMVWLAQRWKNQLFQVSILTEFLLKWGLTYLISLAESNRTPIPAFCLSNYLCLDSIFIFVMIYHAYYDRVHSYTWNIKICVFPMGLPV